MFFFEKMGVENSLFRLKLLNNPWNFGCENEGTNGLVTDSVMK